MRGVPDEEFSPVAVRHVLRALTRQVDRIGIPFPHASLHMRKADLDGSGTWTASELGALLRATAGPFIEDAIGDHVLHDTLRGCVHW